MDIIWGIFEVAIDMAYGIILTQFIVRYFGYRENIGSKIIYTCSLIVLLFAAITFNNIFLPYYEGYLGLFIYVFITFVFAMVALKGGTLEKLFATLLQYGLLTMVSKLIVPIVSRIFGTDIMETLAMEVSWNRLVTIIIGTSVYYLLLELVIFVKRKNNELKPKQWTFLLCVPLVSSVLMVSLFEAAISHRESLAYLISNFISIISVLGLNFLAYFVITELTKNNKIETEYKMLKQSKSYEEKNIEDIQRIYDETRVIRHDVKHHDKHILSELQKIPDISPGQQKQIDKIKKYISDLDEEITDVSYKIITGNSVVDNILNYKISSAEKAGIKVSYYIENNPIEIPNIDICRIFGNLFDNAIEACKNSGVEDKNIEIRMYKKKVYRCIMVSNTTNSLVLKTNPDLVSTKKEKDLHGFGLKSIRSIVEKYDGFFNFYEKNNRIFFEILLAEVDLEDKI